MAAILVTTIKRFLGTAAEMAALSTAGLPAGSTFFQTDTGLLYVLDSGSSWNVKKITAVNATHDSLNVNANMQVGDADVGAANPVPTTLSGSNAYQSGNPYPIAKDCVIANTNYDIDVNAGLTRNGHFGLIQAHENNTGVVSVWISFNGTTFTASAIARLQAGDALSLDGLDIDTIRVQSTIAGDDVLGGVW